MGNLESVFGNKFGASFDLSNFNYESVREESYPMTFDLSLNRIFSRDFLHDFFCLEPSFLLFCDLRWIAPRIEEEEEEEEEKVE